MQESCYWPFLFFTLYVLESITYNTIKSLSTVHMMTFFSSFYVDRIDQFFVKPIVVISQVSEPREI